MEQDFIKVKLFVKLTWLLAGLSVSACLIRNDYNVLFAFLMLIIFNRFYSENPKIYGKILIHLLGALVLVDVLWLIIMMPYWNSTAGSKNPYWESLSGVHTFTLVLAFLELFLKIGMAGLLFFQYKKSYPNDVNDLFKISYLGSLNQSSIQKSEIQGTQQLPQSSM